MGFEAPFALLALAAAALPILAHLMRRRDLPTVKLPTIALLAQARAASQKRVRIVDLLLLIARVLLVISAALALAGPLLRERVAFGDGRVTSVAIVVDDSMSMSRGEPTLLSRSAARALEVVGALPSGSEVAIIAGGGPARVLLSRTTDRDAAEQVLEALGSRSARGTALGRGVELAERELAGARHASRRLLVLSDFAAHARLAELPESDIERALERIGADASDTNAGVTSARAVPDPTTPGQASLTVEVRQHGLDGRRLPLVVRRGEVELAREELELGGPSQRTSVHVPLDAGDPALTVTLEASDELPEDDTRALIVTGAHGARVVVVDGDPQPVRGNDEARLLARALELAPPEGGALSHRVVDPDTFATMSPGDADVIVLANVPVLSREVAARLSRAVEQGVGLWITAGDHVDARSYVARLGELLPARPIGPSGAPIGGPDVAAGSDLLPRSTSGLSQTRTSQRLLLEEPGPASEVWLAYADGAPALVASRHGDGRVALLTTSIDPDWTDLPYRPGFVPLVVSVVSRLSRAAGAPTEPIAPGAALSLRPPAGAQRMRLTDPRGGVHEWTDELGASVEVRATEHPGLYRVEVSTRQRGMRPEPRLAFVVAPPPEESDLRAGPMPEADAERGPREQESMVSRPLAPWLFLLVGLLAAGEAALRFTRRTRAAA